LNTADKNIAKRNLAICIRKIIDSNKESGDSVNSLRKLAASSSLEYSLIQKITSGKKDPQFTTLVALAEGLNLKLYELIKLIEDLTEDDFKKYKIKRLKSASKKKNIVSK
jgi:hypothetical protein